MKARWSFLIKYYVLKIRIRTLTMLMGLRSKWLGKT
jgi:hypothetical protein